MNRPDWRHAWRWWSVRVSALGSILMAAAIAAPDQLLLLWNMLPLELRARMPEHVGLLISLGLFLLVIVVRMVPQKAPDEARSLLGSKSGKASAKAAGLTGIVAALIAGVIAVEGDYVNHPNDPGGETRFGVVKKVAVQNGYTGPMRTMPREVAESIYYQRYLVAPGYAPLVDVDAAVTEELFDTTVNMGASRPSRWFQAAIGAQCGVAIAVDGRVGPATIAAYRACQGKIGATKLCVGTLTVLDTRQRAEYDRLVRINPKLRVFHKGWVAHRVGNVDRRKCSAKPAAPR
jgi:hypothetical protein